VYEGPNDKKLSHSHEIINKAQTKEVMYTESQHTKGLQKSRYIVIEGEETRLKKLADLQLDLCRNLDDY